LKKLPAGQVWQFCVLLLKNSDFYGQGKEFAKTYLDLVKLITLFIPSLSLTIQLVFVKLG